jgi:hypothetical protein
VNGTISGVGALIASRRSANPIGWIMIAVGVLLSSGILARDYATYSLLVHLNALPFGDLMASLSTWVTIPGLALLVFFVLLFPDGRLPSPRWRVVAWASAVASAVMTTGTAMSPEPVEGFRGVRSPVGVAAFRTPEDVIGWAFFVALAVITAACGLAALGSQLVRLRRARGQQRQQVKRFAYGAGLAATAYILGYFFVAELAIFFSMMGLIGMPIAIGVAILRHRLYDIDFIINRTLVYGALTAVLALVYVGGVFGLGDFVRNITGKKATTSSSRPQPLP